MHSGKQQSSLQDACLQDDVLLPMGELCLACVAEHVVVHDLQHRMIIDPVVHAHVNATNDPHIHKAVQLSLYNVHL